MVRHDFGFGLCKHAEDDDGSASLEARNVLARAWSSPGDSQLLRGLSCDQVQNDSL